MAITYGKKFYKSIPGGPDSPIMKKVEKFISQLKDNNKIISKLSRGLYCRKIASTTNRYKFRVSNGDRIVFYYENGHQDICLLKYCKHDDQISVAKNIKDIHLSLRKYEPDEFDEKIDHEILEEIKENIQNDDIEKAYIISKKVSSKTNLTKDLRKALTIKELQQEYHSITDADNESGILIDTNRKSDLYKNGIKYAFNRVFSEYHVLLPPYFKIIIPETVILMPFFSSNANKETDPRKYIEALTEDLYAKIGMTRQKSAIHPRPLLLQGFFYDRDKKVKNMYIEMNPYDRKIRQVNKFRVNMALNNTEKINSYLHAISLTNPASISRANYEYLFE